MHRTRDGAAGIGVAAVPPHFGVQFAYRSPAAFGAIAEIKLQRFVIDVSRAGFESVGAVAGNLDQSIQGTDNFIVRHFHIPGKGRVRILDREERDGLCVEAHLPGVWRMDIECPHYGAPEMMRP